MAQIKKIRDRETQILAKVTQQLGLAPGFRIWVSCLQNSLHSSTREKLLVYELKPQIPWHPQLSHRDNGVCKRRASSLLILVTHVLYTTDIFLTKLIVIRIVLNKLYF